MNVKIAILFVLVGIFAVVMFTNEGYGKSLTTSPNVNKIGTLKTNDFTARGMIGVELGTSASITTVNFTFKNNVNRDEVLGIVLKDKNGIQIGSGSLIATSNSKTQTVNLSDTVTSIERINLRIIDVTLV